MFSFFIFLFLWIWTMCLVVPSLEDDLELRKNHQDNPKVQCLCTINLVLDPMIENTSTGSINHKKTLASLSPILGCHLRVRSEQNTQHNYREERKNKEKEIWSDLVAMNRSALSQWLEAQTCLDLRQTWWARSTLDKLFFEELFFRITNYISFLEEWFDKL